MKVNYFSLLKPEVYYQLNLRETKHLNSFSVLNNTANVFAFLHHQVTETRTGPLGCSNYDNLDSVSSVLVQSPENKIQLQGM